MFYRDSLTLPFINCGTSIYAGFVIFSMLGYMSESQGVPISEVARDGKYRPDFHNNDNNNNNDSDFNWANSF